MFEYNIIENNELDEVENLRKRVLNLTMVEKSFYYKELKNGKMQAIGVVLNNKLIAGAYISNSLNSLYIEQIFVDKQYQNKGVATNLINYIHKNKSIFENYFNSKFNVSKLEPNSKQIKKFYENLGYVESNDFQQSMKKRI